MGGDDVEEYYCPELEWDWDDGGKSVQESDCPPFEAGVTKIERRFTAEHEYRKAGVYNVKVTMRSGPTAPWPSHGQDHGAARPGRPDPGARRQLRQTAA